MWTHRPACHACACRAGRESIFFWKIPGMCRTHPFNSRKTTQPKTGTKPAVLVIVDSPGIEPGTRQCECRVIPLYYEPFPLSECRESLSAQVGNSGLKNALRAFPRKYRVLSVRTFVGVPRIELGSHAPEARILPLYYTPTKILTPKITLERNLVHSGGFESYRFGTVFVSRSLRSARDTQTFRILRQNYARA